jgi:hypothetical protein
MNRDGILARREEEKRRGARRRREKRRARNFSVAVERRARLCFIAHERTSAESLALGMRKSARAAKNLERAVLACPLDCAGRFGRTKQWIFLALPPDAASVEDALILQNRV